MARAPTRSAALQAPVGGWDTREALADMPETSAIIMDNWFPSADKVTMRRGFTEHVTGIGSAVESLVPYTGLTGASELFAVANGSVYDVTSAGSVGAAVVTGLNNSRVQTVQMGTSGGQFLLGFNGDGTPVTYNGTTWSTTSIAGPTSANLIWANLHQRRLWFGEVDSLSAWYLAPNAISGAATEFPLAGIADLGGYIMAMGTWSRDSGAGQDDVAVFVTSEGQAIVYAGTDPASASTWQLVGVFRIGKPIGRRCMMKAGADLVMITQDGFVTASSILTVDRTQADRVALSSQINRAVNDAVRDYGSVYGWQPILYPKGTQMLFNVPLSSTESHQYVFNTITGAPARFTGMNANCWALAGDNLYFAGSDGTVFLADNGMSDNGSNIAGDVLQAFSYFRSSQVTKAFKLCEPVFESTGDPNAALDLNIDFQVRQPTGTSSPSATTSARWGISKWGIGVWGTNGQIFRGWRGVRGIGRAAALRIRVNSQNARPSWVSTNFTYIPGGQL